MRGRRVWVAQIASAPKPASWLPGACPTEVELDPRNPHFGTQAGKAKANGLKPSSVESGRLIFLPSIFLPGQEPRRRSSAAETWRAEERQAIRIGVGGCGTKPLPTLRRDGLKTACHEACDGGLDSGTLVIWICFELQI